MKLSLLSLFLAPVVLMACGSSSNETGAGVDAARTIHGRARLLFGGPAKGLVVHVRSQSARADDQGAFVLPGAWPRGDAAYSLVGLCGAPATDRALHPCEGEDFQYGVEVSVFEGLSTETLDLTIDSVGWPVGVTGALGGTSFPLPATDLVRYGIEDFAVYDPFFVTPDGAIGGQLNWALSSTRTIDLVALHVTGTERMQGAQQVGYTPTGYPQLARRAGVAISSSPSELVDLSMTLVPNEGETFEQRGQVELAPGTRLLKKDFVVSFGAADLVVGGVSDALLSAAEPAFSFVAPRLDGAIVSACASATGVANTVDGVTADAVVAGCQTATAPGDPLTVKLPALVVPHAPAGATQKLPAVLAWDAPAGTSRTSVLATLGPKGDPGIVIRLRGVTKTGQLTMPDLAALGVTVGAGWQLQWTAAATNRGTLEEIAAGDAGAYLLPFARKAGELAWSSTSAPQTLIIE
ncbi:MAG: hypothetical protein JWP97_6248 [Labilithrix sp.]|nr:hypothetical protein [Labilithrix sp.]